MEMEGGGGVKVDHPDGSGQKWVSGKRSWEKKAIHFAWAQN
jgi:hypothetical protein